MPAHAARASRPWTHGQDGRATKERPALVPGRGEGDATAEPEDMVAERAGGSAGASPSHPLPFGYISRDP